MRAREKIITPSALKRKLNRVLLSDGFTSDQYVIVTAGEAQFISDLLFDNANNKYKQKCWKLQYELNNSRAELDKLKERCEREQVENKWLREQLVKARGI